MNKKTDAIKSRNIEFEQGRRANIEVQKVLEMMVSGEPSAPSKDSPRRSKSLKKRLYLLLFGMLGWMRKWVVFGVPPGGVKCVFWDARNAF